MSSFLNDLHKHSYDLDRIIAKCLGHILTEAGEPVASPFHLNCITTPPADEEVRERDIAYCIRGCKGMLRVFAQTGVFPELCRSENTASQSSFATTPRFMEVGSKSKGNSLNSSPSQEGGDFKKPANEESKLTPTSSQSSLENIEINQEANRQESRSALVEMSGLFDAINSERKLFRDQNIKLLNKIAMLQMDRTSLHSNPGFQLFVSRSYRMQQEIKAKRIERLEKENQDLRLQRCQLQQKRTDLESQLQQIREGFHDSLTKSQRLIEEGSTCVNRDSARFTPQQLSKCGKMCSYSSSSRSSSCFGSKAPSPIRNMNISGSKESMILTHNKGLLNRSQKRSLHNYPPLGRLNSSRGSSESGELTSVKQEGERLSKLRNQFYRLNSNRAPSSPSTPQPELRDSQSSKSVARSSTSMGMMIHPTSSLASLAICSSTSSLGPNEPSVKVELAGVSYTGKSLTSRTPVKGVGSMENLNKLLPTGLPLSGQKKCTPSLCRSVVTDHKSQGVISQEEKSDGGGKSNSPHSPEAKQTLRNSPQSTQFCLNGKVCEEENNPMADELMNAPQLDLLSDAASSPEKSPEKENFGLQTSASTMFVKRKDNPLSPAPGNATLKRQTSVTSLFLSKSSSNIQLNGTSAGSSSGLPKTPKLEEAQFKLRSRMTEVIPKTALTTLINKTDSSTNSTPKLIKRTESRIPSISGSAKLRPNRSQTSVGLNLSGVKRGESSAHSSRRTTLIGMNLKASIPPLNSGRQSCASMRAK